MESDWSKKFLMRNGERRVSPIVLVFIALQVLLLIVFLVSMAQLKDDNMAKTDAEYYANKPELTIVGLADKYPDLTEYDISNIQKKVFDIISENTSSLDTAVEATIRDDSFHARSFNENTKYMNAIIDIPSLEQSYEFYYSSNAVLDPEVSTYVLCLDGDARIIYENFECKSSDSESIRDRIIPAYINYLNPDFDYFSIYLNPDKADTIVISPSVTYNNSETTKADYIREAKESIQSLGFSPEKYTYYVRTLADVNYDNNR